LVFPRGDARLDFTDLYAFPKPGDPSKSVLVMDVHPSFGVNPKSRLEPDERFCAEMPLLGATSLLHQAAQGTHAGE